MMAEQRMRKNPFTGVMEPYTPRVMGKVDLVEAKPLDKEQKQSEYNRCLAALKAIRAKYAGLSSAKRGGATGDKLLKQYRYEAAKLLHVSGEKAPKIYDDL